MRLILDGGVFSAPNERGTLRCLARVGDEYGISAITLSELYEDVDLADSAERAAWRRSR